jgi:hypothetical protein
VVVKVSPGPGEVPDLVERLSALASDAEKRHRLGASAREWVARYHKPELVADRYISFLEQRANGAEKRPPEGAIAVQMNRALAGTLVDLDLDRVSDGLLRRLARPVAELTTE